MEQLAALIEMRIEAIREELEALDALSQEMGEPACTRLKVLKQTLIGNRP